MLKIKLINNFLVFVFTAMILSQITFAQETKDNKQLNDLVSTLKQKVLLSNDQETKVLNILSELKNNLASKPESKDVLVDEAQKKVESLLDSKQKMKYDILKKDFWKKVTE